MIELNKIYNMDCIEFMSNANVKVDVILTSPPYNTSRKMRSGMDTNQIRYEDFNDSKSNEEYIDWTLKVFDGFDNILRENGCVLYNISYSAENTELMFKVIASILDRTAFTIADSIVWKKTNALPNNTSPNRLTRICEYVFVFCRKDEMQTFRCNKKINDGSKSGQKYYENIFNIIEAPNNDEACPIHKATYSSLLCRKLMKIYAPEGSIVYDPFMGTGTTAIACIKDHYTYIGTELSANYCNYANDRIKKETQQLSLW